MPRMDRALLYTLYQSGNNVLMNNQMVNHLDGITPNSWSFASMVTAFMGAPLSGGMGQTLISDYEKSLRCVV